MKLFHRDPGVLDQFGSLFFIPGIYIHPVILFALTVSLVIIISAPWPLCPSEYLLMTIRISSVTLVIGVPPWPYGRRCISMTLCRRNILPCVHPSTLHDLCVHLSIRPYGSRDLLGHHKTSVGSNVRDVGVTVTVGMAVRSSVRMAGCSIRAGVAGVVVGCTISGMRSSVGCWCVSMVVLMRSVSMAKIQ